MAAKHDPLRAQLPHRHFDKAGRRIESRGLNQLQAILDGMPADTPLPFPHRSLSAFRQRAAAAKKNQPGN